MKFRVILPRLATGLGILTMVAIAGPWPVLAAQTTRQHARPLAPLTSRGMASDAPRSRVAASDAVVTTLAGTGVPGLADGPAGVAQLLNPTSVAAQADGTLYLVDGDRIRRVTPAGQVTTLAGGDNAGFRDGPAAGALFNGLTGIAVDAGGTLYLADRDNNRIRKLTPDGQVSTVAGTGSPGHADGPAAGAQFNGPAGVAVDASGTLYVADSLNHCIRRISRSGEVSTLAGPVGEDAGMSDYVDGQGQAARFSLPSALTVDAAGNIYVADTYNARIRVVSPAGAVRTVAGSGEDGGADGPAGVAQFSDPLGIAVDGAGTLYVVDKTNRVRRITADGSVTTLAGSGIAGYRDGPAASAQFAQPQGAAVDAAGAVYIADTGNARLRRIVPGAVDDQAKVSGTTAGVTTGDTSGT